MLNRLQQRLAALLLPTVMVLAACSADPKDPVQAPAPTSTTSTAPVQYVAPPVAVEPNPLNGLPGGPSAVVFAAKIDDTAAARPQIGIAAADIVYIEQVEAGLTRLMAVFSHTLPPRVGPVRSVRASDTQILAQYGRVGLAFSGGAPPQLAIVAGSNVVSASADTNPQFYSRAGDRSAPYNLILDLPAMAGAIPVAGGKSVGFLWGAYPSLAAAPAGTALTVPVGQTGVDFRFDPNTGRYVRIIDGMPQFDAAGPAVSTANVIVMFCQVGPDGVGADVNGSPTIGTTTVGSGPVVVFRDGRRIDGIWTRTTPEGGTVLTDPAGLPIRLAAGGAWVVLAANGAPLISG